MKEKKNQHFLDETIKRAKIENAQKEAKNIYNYNEWKENHDRLVEHELRKMNRKKITVGKAIAIGILLAVIIEILIIVTNNNVAAITAAINEIKYHFKEIINIIIKLSTV